MSTKGAKSQEVRLLGEGISRGIAIGEPYLFSYQQPTVPVYPVSLTGRKEELRRFLAAVDKGREELLLLQRQLECEGAQDAIDIVEAQLQFIADPTIIADMTQGIMEEGRNAEAVFQALWKRYRAQFQSIGDSFFRERWADLEDLYRRILRHLLGGSQAALASVPKSAIVFATELSPSDTASVQGCAIGAFVTQKGGATSHAAIVARAKGIPYIANLDLSRLPKNLHGPVIVDGRTGVVILNPKPATLQKYRTTALHIADAMADLERQAEHKSETYDGHHIRLSANLEDVTELSLLHGHGGYGIGLFRSEYLFLSRSGFPSEEEQYDAYRTMLSHMDGLPVVIRAFDVGGDKHAAEQRTWKELNPFLGCRAIRFLLRKPEIFRTQLRAILRASAHGNISLLFPMVSSLQELREAKNIVDQVRHKLISEGHKIPAHLSIGSMIEVPSAALIADVLAQECDFLSIGTNDLVQYALAVDRSNDAMSGHYAPTHPGVLRLMKFVVAQANQHGISVSLCGEMAADPRLTALLIGLGLTELSVASRHIPLIKHVIRRTSIVEARHLANQALALADAGEVLSFLSNEYRRTAPEDVLYNPR